MEPKPLPPWVIILTAFCVFGICCASAFLSAPSWAHLIPTLPARVAQSPTLTPIPSATPTAFSLPTRTPTAVPIEKPIVFPTMESTKIPPLDVQQASNDSNTYKFNMQVELTLFRNDLLELQELFQSPRIGDRAWRASVEESFTSIHTTYIELSAMIPPIEFRGIHNELTGAIRDCDLGGQRFLEGLDTLSSTDMQLAGQFIVSCGTRLNQLGDQVQGGMIPTLAPIESTVTPIPTFTQIPVQLIPTNSPVQSDCTCSFDAYNCDNPQADRCYSVCVSQGAGDIHGLDRDGDGRACE